MSEGYNVRGPDRDEMVAVWNGAINMRVRVAGDGPAIIYFHPAAGLYWDRFLDELARNHTVYAPELPGTTPGDPYAIHRVETYNDLLLIYEEMLRALKLGGAVAVGQSMGGMIALDLACYFPSLFSRVVGLSPCGLWLDEAPIGIADLYAAAPDTIPSYLFNDPSIPGAQAMFSLPEDPEAIPAHVAQNVWALGCAGKFLWPFPDHGMRSRLHRIAAPTMVLWGADDKVVPAVYAREFAEGIDNCEVHVYGDCGHIVQMEKLDETLTDIRRFVS